MSKSKIVKVQEHGAVTLPAELRRKLGLSKGNFVTFTEIEGGVLLKPADPIDLLDAIGEELRRQGVTLDDLIASGREIRGELIKEQYGISPTKAT